MVHNENIAQPKINFFHVLVPGQLKNCTRQIGTSEKLQKYTTYNIVFHIDEWMGGQNNLKKGGWMDYWVDGWEKY